MVSIDTLFFELIRVSIGTQTTLSRLPSEAEWEELFDMAMEQMGRLFGKSRMTILGHIQNIYEEGELVEGDTMKKVV